MAPYACSDDLDLHFAGKPVTQLRCFVFGHIIDDIDDITVPLLAYVDDTEISRSREDSVQLPPCRIPNLPNWNLRLATLARIQPTNITQDPYFVGILIALAQAQLFARFDDTAAHLYPLTVHLSLSPWLTNVC